MSVRVLSERVSGGAASRATGLRGASLASPARSENTCSCRKHAIDPDCPRHGIGKGNFRANVASVVAFFVVAVLAVFTAPSDAAVRTKPRWMSQFAWAVAICETGKGNRYPDFRHRTRSYGGAWGWFHGTWRLDAPKSFPRNSWQASPRQQYRVFLIGRSRGRHWGCIAHGGYRSWM